MEPKYPIRVVAAKTGLSSHLIRMWERRYRAVEPLRTDTYRRLYSDSDVRRLSLLRRATQAGANIGQIANLADDDLRELVDSYERIGADGNSKSFRPPDPDHFVNLGLDAVRSLDGRRLESVLLQASVDLGRIILLEEVVMRLLERVGSDWSSGRMKVAHEHLASSTIRSFLGHLAETTPSDQTAPLLITATPAGQLHEFGALMSSVAAVAAGWQVTYLGPNLPAEDIAGTVRQTGARAVALSIIYPPDDGRLADELRTVRRLIDGNIPIFIGGRAKSRYRKAIEEIGATMIEDLHGFTDYLGTVRSHSTDNGGQ